jgi:hypothetical protein
MGPPGFTEPAHQGRVVGFEENEARAHQPAQTPVQRGEAFERGAFANIDDNGGLADIRGVLGQLSELRDQIDGEIVDRVVAQILERF